MNVWDVLQRMVHLEEGRRTFWPGAAARKDGDVITVSIRFEGVDAWQDAAELVAALHPEATPSRTID